VSINAEKLAVARDSTVPTLQLPDLLRKNLDVVFCGINPALSAAQAGHHFLSRSNRFWRVLHLAGFTPHVIRPENDRTVLEFGCGLTAAVERPTVRASELADHEFHEAAAALERKLRHYRPRSVAFLGKPAFAAIFRQKGVDWGPQVIRFGGAKVWVLPNPSGLNRAFNLDALITLYRELRTASSRLDSRRERPDEEILPITTRLPA
jgi:TDG/mug DNA glycosylase family protein